MSCVHAACLLLNAKYLFSIPGKIIFEHRRVERQLARVVDRLYDRSQRICRTVNDLFAQRGIGSFDIGHSTGREYIHVGRNVNVWMLESDTEDFLNKRITAMP